MEDDDSHSQMPGEEPAVAEAQAQAHQTPEQLIARAIAPIKKEFLRPPPVRASSTNDDVSTANDKNPPQSGSAVLKEKKSKRQLKRERRQVNYKFLPSLFAYPLFILLLPHFNCSLLNLANQFLFFNIPNTICRNKSQHEISARNLQRLVMLLRVLIKTNVASATILKPSRPRYEIPLLALMPPQVCL